MSPIDVSAMNVLDKTAILVPMAVKAIFGNAFDVALRSIGDIEVVTMNENGSILWYSPLRERLIY